MGVAATRDEVPPDTSLPGLDPLGDPYLRTRFTLPGRPATFLRRARLDEHLGQALLTPLTLVNGCAGAGKTLLVADWAERLDQPVAWLTLDAAVEGPGMFWAHLIRSLDAAGVPIPAAIGLPADATRVHHTLLSRLAAELAGRDRPVVVVIDEYDQMTDPEVARQLDFVLQHARPGLRLVLVTRTEPLLPLHRYRVAGEMTEIRDAELAFTPEEAVTLLGLHGLPLDVPGARPLVERTRGWAAGLRLCALAARSSPDPERYLKEFEAGRGAIADFLLAEVLERQTPETQDLLLRISVLDRFRPELADELTERTDAAEILAELHRANAFVEDFGHGWYRLHPLFREILRAHLRRRAPGLEPRLHRRAAHWLRRSGALPEMLAHGAAAQDWTYVARALVEDLAIGQLFTGLGTEVPPEWFAGLEAETRDPAANLVRAARELSRFDLGQGLAHLRRAEEQLAADDGGSRAAQLSRALLEALAGRLSGSAHRAERAARSAGRLMPQLPPRLVDGHPELGALLLTHVGASRLWAGHFDEARAALTAVSRGPRTAATVLPRMGALEHLALVDHLHGWPSAAERKVHAMTAEAERYGAPQPSGSGLGQLVLAAVALDRDDVDRAEALLADTAHDPPPADPVAAAARRFVTAGVLLARGRTRAALAVAAQAVPAADHSPWAQGRAALVASAAHLAEGDPDAAGEALRRVAGEQPLCTVGAARALVAAGDPGAALRLLDGHPDHSRAGPGVVVPAMLVRAQAAKLTGDAATARGLLAQALLEGRGEELRRPFREAGPWILPFLAEPPLRSLAAGWLVPDLTPTHAERTLPAPAPAHAGPTRPGPAPTHAERNRGGDDPGPLLEQLSPREHEVLERLARTMSTEDIAADLYVSVNTVKTHLKSAYRKLSVHRRNDAVRRARELGLL
ncbi:LuxR C-terminal-related transcriptional regulator [Streptomyces sp. LMG1-1-1.1]|uniref:LuxR C-terminal-related transcriptional regulator n=1 Tax=Streptomyces sp. LMG1-1-1.1 TaxID=3135245 RepID=UPI0034C0CB02